MTLEQLLLAALALVGGYAGRELLGIIFAPFRKRATADYVTRDECSACRSECEKRRHTEESALIKEVKALGKRIDNLQRMLAKQLLGTSGSEADVLNLIGRGADE